MITVNDVLIGGAIILGIVGFSALFLLLVDRLSCHKTIVPNYSTNYFTVTLPIYETKKTRKRKCGFRQKEVDHESYLSQYEDDPNYRIIKGERSKDEIKYTYIVTT
jgi:hypothetical protein